jgi:hypothetical protein
MLRCNAICSGRYAPIYNLMWRNRPEHMYKNLHKLSEDKIPLLQHSGGGGYSCFVEANSIFHNTWQVSSDVLSYSAWRLVYYILLGQQEMIPQPKRSFRPYTRTALRPLLELWNHPLTVVLSCCSRDVPWCDDEYVTTFIHSCRLWTVWW